MHQDKSPQKTNSKHCKHQLTIEHYGGFQEWFVFAILNPTIFSSNASCFLAMVRGE